MRAFWTAALAVVFASVPAHAEKIGPNCTFDGLTLQGNVKVVDSFPDLKIQVVESFPDLRVTLVTSFPDACGKWRFVESFPDFTIQFVDSFPDVKITLVDSFPGIP
ncbi:MAG: hypothetical protein U5J99_11005 [Parvularculaceae bacterium]|nr:hypothetical protein [Parvularculaceae bacterium]